MNKLFCCAMLSLALISCNDSGTGPAPYHPPANGLTASPSSVRVSPGSFMVVLIGKGTSPDSILILPNTSIATATLNDTVLTVQGVAVGSTSVRVGDSSTPKKTVDIGITIATSAAAIIMSGK